VVLPVYTYFYIRLRLHIISYVIFTFYLHGNESIVFVIMKKNKLILNEFLSTKNYLLKKKDMYAIFV
jgi:hypothetical protein